MPKVHDETGRVFTTGERLGGGGQGEVFRLEGVPGVCVKVYTQRPAATQTQKLRLLRERSAGLTNAAALPLSVAFADAAKATAVGFFQPVIGGQEVYELYGTRSRIQHFPSANWKFLVHAAFNLAVAFEALHAANILVGDVNEGNVKVLPDATVRLIDADSFQVTDGATVYPSNVGTPIWTPAELQGQNLAGFTRTPNHDLFGLSQMLFLLLFTGRHPFSGVPRGGRQLTIDDAIREQAFAFAPERFGVPLTPPPGCPRLDMLPPEMQHLFGRAFLKGSEQAGARPSARQWGEALTGLLGGLVTCARRPSHVYWRGATTCPWCAVVGQVGVDLFPATTGTGGNTAAPASGEESLLAWLQGLRPEQFATTSPPQFPELAPERLPEPPTGFWSSVHRAFSPAGWRRGYLSAALDAHRRTEATATEVLRRLIQEQGVVISTYHGEFARVRTALSPLVQSLGQPGSLLRTVEAAVNLERASLELKEFLQGIPLRRATIPGIGEGRKITLQSHGIETAADVSAAAIGRLHGFGRTLTASLMDWRRRCETRFRFDPTRAPTPALRQEIERRLQERMKVVRAEAAKQEIALNEARRRCVENLRKAEAQIVQAARQRDQAKANAALIEGELRRI